MAAPAGRRARPQVLGERSHPVRRRARRIEAGHGGHVPRRARPRRALRWRRGSARGQRVQRGLGRHHERRLRARHVQERVQQGGRAAFDRADLPERTVDEQILASPQAKGPEIRRQLLAAYEARSRRPRGDAHLSSAHALTAVPMPLTKRSPVRRQAVRAQQGFDPFLDPGPVHEEQLAGLSVRAPVRTGPATARRRPDGRTCRAAGPPRAGDRPARAPRTWLPSAGSNRSIRSLSAVSLTCCISCTSSSPSMSTSSGRASATAPNACRDVPLCRWPARRGASAPRSAGPRPITLA